MKVQMMLWAIIFAVWAEGCDRRYADDKRPTQIILSGFYALLSCVFLAIATFSD